MKNFATRSSETEIADESRTKPKRIARNFPFGKSICKDELIFARISNTCRSYRLAFKMIDAGFDCGLDFIDFGITNPKVVRN